MSLYATIDDEEAGDVATSSGWSDFVRVVEMFNGVDELRQLTEYGWADDGSQLVADISGMIDGGSLSDDQASIAMGLLAIAERMIDGQVVTISDGVGVNEEVPA